MKVGILTYHFAYNYGAVLQAWALHQAIQQLGHEVEIIRFEPKTLSFWLIKRWFARQVKLCILKWQGEWVAHKKRSQFASFQSKLTLGPKCYHTPESLRSDPPSYDAYVCGSDQIWWCTPLKNTSYFLDFGDDRVKRIAYASSLGTDVIPEEFKQEIKRCLKRFSRISVRESSGAKALQELGFACEVMPDPTLLLSPETYKLVTSGVPINENVFIYLLHQDHAKLSLSCETSIREMKCPIYNVDLHQNSTATFNQYLPSVEEWLLQLSHSSFVITNSFHAVVFSIIFHRPFIVELRAGEGAKMNDRILTLLNIVGLNHLAIDVLTPESLRSAHNESIDWVKVDEKVDRARQSGRDYLNQALAIREV